MLQLEPPDTVLQGILGWTKGYDGESPAPWKEAPEGRRQARARTWLRLVWERDLLRRAESTFSQHLKSL